MSETPRRDDENDARLSALYRAADADVDGPPPALDDAIRAAARREVGAGPRRAGAPFLASWQVPLSIAAVLVLCVSLVAVMRDEGGELTQLPRADTPEPAVRGRDAAEQASAVPKIELAPEATRAKSLGFKPSSPPANTPASAGNPYALLPSGAGPGLRATPGQQQPALKQNADARVADSISPRAAPSAFPEKAVVAAAPAVAPAESSGKLQARQDAGAAVEPAPVAAAAESRSRFAGNVASPAAGAVTSAVEAAPQARRESAAAERERDAVRAPAPAAQAKAAAEPAPALEKPASELSRETADAVAQMARLTPDKWLERIGELRRQGRTDEARAGLAEFRRRYPDYALPPALRDWVRP